MNRLKIILGLSVLLVIAGILIIKFVPPGTSTQPAQALSQPTQALSQPARALSQDDPDFTAIQTTLRTYAEIDNEARYTLDDSRLSEVLANDPRGGLVNPELVKSVQYMSGNPDLKIEDIGFLDVNQVGWAFERKVKQVYDDAIASGKVVVPTPPPYDPSENPVSIDIRGTDADPRAQIPLPNPLIVPEIRAMMVASGLGAELPLPETVKRTPTDFKIISISVEGDLAHAKVNWEYGICDDVLVKKDGSWYLIGHHIIEWHV